MVVDSRVGIEVRDTTSPEVLSGSLIWDGSNNQWKGELKVVKREYY